MMLRLSKSTTGNLRERLHYPLTDVVLPNVAIIIHKNLKQHAGLQGYLVKHRQDDIFVPIA